ncbi:MAG: cytochrome P450 [Patulibacter sp.]|nr:cytochrome P450 [Patulibacter sp.]
MTATAPHYEPGSQEHLLDPLAAAAGSHADTPVFFSEAMNAYVVVGYDAARAALKDFASYSSRAFKGLPVREGLRDRIPAEWERVAQLVQGAQLNNTDPPTHTTQRRAIQRAFTRKQVEDAKPHIERIANELIDGFEADGSCDLMQDFASQLTVRVVGSMLALPEQMIPGFLAWIGDVFAVLAPIDLDAEDVTVPDDQLVATFERLHAAHLTYVELLEERRANPGDDLASAMLALTDDDGAPLMATEDVLAHMLGLTAAGTDTTAALITNMVRYFTADPEQLRLVLDDPGLWDNAIQEGLRRASVALHGMRIATETTVLAGCEIPQGSAVYVALGAANADPSVFRDPLRFDIRRENAKEHLGLGIGRHKCLGAPLVPPEVRLALEVLYQRLPGLKADLDQELRFAPSPVVRVAQSQRVSW